MDKKLKANKKVVMDFFRKAFIDKDPENAVRLYVGRSYRQHNPLWSDGKESFIQIVKQQAKNNPNRKFDFKRVIAEGNYVVLHLHQILTKNDRDVNLAPNGKAVIDIFRLENGKIVEHWDVVQFVPTESANMNTMF